MSFVHVSVLFIDVSHLETVTGGAGDSCIDVCIKKKMVSHALILLLPLPLQSLRNVLMTVWCRPALSLIRVAHYASIAIWEIDGLS